MQATHARADEAQSLEALHALQVLDTAPEAEFDALVRAACLACAAPIALISLVDAERQWFKAGVGLAGVTEFPRGGALCAYAVLGNVLFEVPDASQDPRFADHPLVVGQPKIRFYAGAPVRLSSGQCIGVLCIIDLQPRQLSDSQRESLQALALVAALALEGRQARLRLPKSPELAEQTGRAAGGGGSAVDTSLGEVIGSVPGQPVLGAGAGPEPKPAQSQNLYDNAPCGLCWLDTSGTFLHLNATASTWLGCSGEDLIGKRRALDFVSPDGQAQFSQGLLNLATTGRVEALEFELVPAAGTGRRVRVTATAACDAQGRFQTTCMAMFDITELDRERGQQSALIRQQAAMLDNELIGICMLRGRLVTWKNRGMDRSFGYRDADWQGMTLRRLYPDGEAYERSWRGARAAMRETGMFRAQIQMMRRDGSLVWIDAQAVTLSAARDEVLMLLTDITPLEKAQEARLKLATLEGQNAQWLETGRLKDQFVGNMSHELRTPLSAILGYAYLLQSGSANPESQKHRHYLAQIVGSGKHLLQLIESMLDMARSQSGRLEFRPESTSVAQAITDVIAMFQDACEQKQLAVTCSVSSDLTQAELDPTRLRQVLFSLLSNAIKFSSERGSIDVRAQLEGKMGFRIEIEDHGIGIAQAELPRLFSPFHQLSAGNTKAYQGAGLGLAWVRRMVEAQGGSVGVRSTFGQGSVFHISLPLAAGEPG